MKCLIWLVILSAVSVEGQIWNPGAQSIGGYGGVTQPSSSVPDTNSYLQFPTAATGTNRNDFSGSLGFSFSLSAPITVDKLGRLYLAGNTGDHAAYIWDMASTGTPVATCTILAASTSDANNFKYCALGSPVALIASHTYAISLDELGGGDMWLDVWSSCCAPNYMQAVFGSTTAGFSGTHGTAPSNFDSGLNTNFDSPSIVYH